MEEAVWRRGSAHAGDKGTREKKNSNAHQCADTLTRTG